MEKDDFLESLGLSALGTRLRRLFEVINTPVSDAYRELADFEQRWFALVCYLDRHGACSVQTAAIALGQSHVSVLQAAKGLEASALLKRENDPADKRVSRLALTDLGKAKVKRVRAISAKVDEAAGALIEEAAPDFLDNLTALERALRLQPFEIRLRKTIANLKRG
ncbi:MAG: hypothetical protein AAF296_06970 [Pseudomonadota bacterium]